MKYRYEIWTKFCPILEEDEVDEPKLQAKCKTMAEVGRYLDLTQSQVRQRIYSSNSGGLSNVWHLKYETFGYQIIRIIKK